MKITKNLNMSHCEIKVFKLCQQGIKLIDLGWYWVTMIFWCQANPEIHCPQAMHNGLIWVKEEGGTGFSEGWQGCSREASLPARGKPCPSRLFYSDLHSISNTVFKVLRSAGKWAFFFLQFFQITSNDKLKIMTQLSFHKFGVQNIFMNNYFVVGPLWKVGEKKL